MRRFWTEEEDEILRKFVQVHGKQWNIIATKLPRRTPTQIAARWEKCLNPDLIKGPFTPEEDQLILEFVERNGPHSWPNISQLIPARSPKQCRERWFNHLNPNVLKAAWSYQEDLLIYEQYLLHGPKWALISKHLPGRTDNAVKNRWHSSISKRIKIDGNGNQFLLHDTSKRNHRNKMETLRPPPLVPPMNLKKIKSSSKLIKESSQRKLKNFNEPPKKVENQNYIKKDDKNTTKIDEKGQIELPDMPTLTTPVLFSPDGLSLGLFSDFNSLLSPFSPHDCINPFLKSDSFAIAISPSNAGDGLFSPLRLEKVDFEFGF
ncbi:Myb-like DNA-binding domain containing protein [Tritrichomonas foetus]|uniref:Myb-like DNA-binding domain containing protein n=1 Tax=Tritrichomonas foetus TaxID=1144522 RepID=A0A1J4KV37_9EUKA|nr:Myb-like DNA-binding domain containing protein [Tritrichomonas foetus]|eukprot:OHT13612.1 Myb-like DNA-binding domain containing protein [Tritrichomonas foetus]